MAIARSGRCLNVDILYALIKLLRNLFKICKMADGHANKCSSNFDLIPLPNRSQVNNLRDEIKCKDGNGVLPPKSKLQLTWTGDFASLKQFVCNII